MKHLTALVLFGVALLAQAQAQAQQLLAEDTERVVRICGVVDATALAAGTFTPVDDFALSTADLAEALREGTATLDISGATWAAVTGSTGCYDLTLSATATSTVGDLTIWIVDADIAPIEKKFQVVEEAVYDACCVASATPLTVTSLLRAEARINCEVNTANFAGSSTTVACILTDADGDPVTAANNDLTGLELKVTSGTQIYEGRFINATTWDSGNSELQLTLSRALPGTLADGVTAIIR